MRVRLNPEAEVFLGDHEVAGAPLLPTVMGLDLLARAALARVPRVRSTPRARVSEISEVRVGPPVRFPQGRARRLHTVERQQAPRRPGLPQSWACKLEEQSGAPAAPAFSCVLLLNSTGVGGEPPVPTSVRQPAELAPEMPVRAGDVYPPYFHGPTFRVIGGAGRAGDGLVALLQHARPELRWSRRAPVTSPALLELVMQVAGLWGLAATGEMMIPDRIDRIELCDATPPVGRTVAHVCPRADADGHTAFDAEVIAEDGRLLLRVAGYRPVGLGQFVDTATSDGINELLGNPRHASAVGST